MRCGAGSYAFPRQLRVTMEAKDLLQNLLCPDPDKRISVAEIEVRCTFKRRAVLSSSIRPGPAAWLPVSANARCATG